MCKHGLCCRLVSVCLSVRLSVRPSVCLSYWCIVSRRLKISSHVFPGRVATTPKGCGDALEFFGDFTSPQSALLKDFNNKLLTNLIVGHIVTGGTKSEYTVTYKAGGKTSYLPALWEGKRPGGNVWGRGLSKNC